ncbi:MAG: DUF3696 domain-containing protein [Egibacteraceae bacterium]
MIRRLRVHHFKRFADVSLPLRPLTVLAGLNGAGKSTLIHALLLVRQVLLGSEQTSPSVALNGPFGLALGESADVLYAEADDNLIRFEVEHDGGVFIVELEAAEDRSVHMAANCSGTRPLSPLRIGLDFAYLSAERLGPRDLLGVSAESGAALGVGEQGQYIAHVLAMAQLKPSADELQVPEILRHPRTPEERVITLPRQVELWASDIIRPLQIEATWHPNTVATSLRFKTPNIMTDPVRPANMGFGVTYGLPIIVAGLLAKPGSMLIVENPEAHLHPAGQSKLGRFLARVAGSGAQVLVETHSDHFLNGVRRGIVEDGMLPSGDAIVHFFGDAARPTSIEVTDRGSLSQWPEGFFDQLDADLAALSRAKRGAGRS